MRSAYLLALSFFLGSIGSLQASDALIWVGTVTNTTNETQPITSNAVISIDGQGTCVVRIDKPLYGSGICTLARYNKDSGDVELVSSGPLTRITWDGAISQDGGFTGKYVVGYPELPELPQAGTFALSVQSRGEQVLKISDVLSSDTINVNGEEYLLWLDGDVLSIHHKDGKYAGLRILLNDDSKPIYVVDDSANGSIYRDATTNQTVLEWITDGRSGYFQRSSNGVITYYNRFFQPTGWTSIVFNSKPLFIKEDSQGAQLYDDSLKPLGIWSGKTTAGNVFWAVDRGKGVTEYLDEAFNPTNWYSVVSEGQTYYALRKGKKFNFYDTDLHPIKTRRQGFWASFARGMAVGMSAYAQAMRAAEVQQNPSAGYSTYHAVPLTSSPSYSSTTTSFPGVAGPSYTTTYGSTGESYSTTTQRLGRFAYSNTTGSNGYWANSTTQSIGAFDYTFGQSSSGNFSGTGQRIGNFDYMHLMTGAGDWNGTGQKIGQFTFYNFSGPDGQNVTATSQRIGNFIFTNIH